MALRGDCGRRDGSERTPFRELMTVHVGVGMMVVVEVCVVVLAAVVVADVVCVVVLVCKDC